MSHLMSCIVLNNNSLQIMTIIEYYFPDIVLNASHSIILIVIMSLPVGTFYPHLTEKG